MLKVNLNKTVENYERDWRFIDEGANTKSEPYQEFVDLDQYSDVHKELRLVADEIMRLEYELLRIAHCKDKKLKYKAPKEPKKKRGKKKKKKFVDERFGDRLVETVYDEMKEAGVICEYQKTDMDKYIGDLNYCAYELRNIFNM